MAAYRWLWVRGRLGGRPERAPSRLFMSTVDVKPSNRRPGAKPEAANEPFKRALASCTRAMARRPDLEIGFSADKPELVAGPEGAKARLPEPPRKPNPREAAILRGLADSMALAARLPQRCDPPPPRAAEPGRARFVRRGRAGAGRGDRLAPDGGRRVQPHRDARRPLSQAARSPRRATATRRRWKTRSRCWCASG